MEASCEVVLCCGVPDRELTAVQTHACERLATVVGADLLGVRFAGEAVAAVTCLPNLDRGATRGLLLARLAREVLA